MKGFRAEIRRLIRIRSSNPALADGLFVVTVGPKGLSVRRKGSPKGTEARLSWRSVVGHVLIHKGE